MRWSTVCDGNAIHTVEVFKYLKRKSSKTESTTLSDSLPKKNSTKSHHFDVYTDFIRENFRELNKTECQNSIEISVN